MKEYTKGRLTAIVVIIVLILIAIGIVWWTRYQLLTPETVQETLAGVKSRTSISFSQEKETSFRWNLKGEDRVFVTGQWISSTNVPTEQIDKVHAFFKKAHFKTDENNVSSGNIGSATGYRLKDIACIVSEVADGTPDEIAKGSAPNNLDIKCGQSEELQGTSLATKEEAIKQLFADRYGVDKSKVETVIAQFTETHIRGSVKISDSETADNTFLAIKTAGEWMIVFDGDSPIACEPLQKYNFPEEMVADCVSSGVEG